jgi:hypothetical protein
MPFAFLIIGAVFVVAGVRGTNTQLTTLLKGDFTGSNNYIYWMGAILIVGALGYIQALKPLSRAFLVLIVIILILGHKGFFAEFNQQLSSTQTVGSAGNALSSLFGSGTGSASTTTQTGALSSNSPQTPAQALDPDEQPQG